MLSTMSRLHQREIAICAILSRLQKARLPYLLFVAASRLGDGMLWYGLMAGLLLAHGESAVPAVAHIAATALAGTGIYLLLKHSARRLRPCEATPQVTSTIRPLDRYSFPSGHTMHAVSFTIMAASYFPALTPWLAPVAAIIAASRIVLGLHYPTDVLIGGLIGAALAQGSLTLHLIL